MDNTNKWASLEPRPLRRGMPGLGVGAAEEALDVIVHKQEPEAIPHLQTVALDNSNNENIRIRAIEWLVTLCQYDQIPLDTTLDVFKNIVSENLHAKYSRIRSNALLAIASLVDPRNLQSDPLDYLLNMYSESKLDSFAREDVLSALAKTRSPAALEPLAMGVMEKARNECIEGVKDIRQLHWKDKADVFFKLIKEHTLRSDQIQSEAIIKALIPERGDGDDAPVKRLVELGDLIIENSKKQDERVSSVMARLLIETEGGSQSQAGYKINEYEKDHKIEKAELAELRKSVGGTAALSGIMGVLQQDLQKYFQEPIHHLNQNTMDAWEKAVKSAHYGLVMRLWMSGLVFVVGLILLLVSCWKILFPEVDDQINQGTFITFASGLGTMILIIYSGPLKEIRQAVTDLANANAAFIAYVHRVLETSHTFSYFYLHQAISFEKMKESSNLIKDAMNDTINALNREALDSSVDVILKALKKHKVNVSKPRINKQK